MAPWEEYGAQSGGPAPWQEYGGQAQPGKPMSRTDKVLTGMADSIHGGAQLLTKVLPRGVVDAGNQINNFLADKTGLVARLPEGGVDEQVREREAQYQQQRAAAGETGFDGYRTVGNVLSPANVALASRLPAAASFGGRILAGAGGGAATAALNPVTEGDFATEKGSQIALGAGFGAAVPAVTGGIARMVSPRASVDPNVQLLRREGVTPTVGQALGGWANRAEEKAMSLPLMGDAISHSREVARRQFNEAAINRATAPIGVRSQGVGQGAVQQAGDRITDAYNGARAALGSFRLDRTGLQEIRRIQAMVGNLPEAQQRSFNATLRAVATDISPNGTIPASVFKRIDSRIGQDAARFSGSSDPYHQQLGDAFTALQTAISGAGRRANPRADAMFSAADRAYANLVRVEGASKAAMNAEGVFTPGQLNMAVRQADQSVRDRATARGTALMQDLGNAGQQVLGNRVPNSGTADRLMLGGAGLGAYLVDPMIPLGLLGGAAMYTQPMQGLLSGAVSARPQLAQPVANALRQASPALVPLGAQVGLGLLN
jgi:hypothetical protein